MMRTLCRLVVPCLVGLSIWSGLASVEAADNQRLAVVGVGKIEVRPDMMELTTTVSGSAELTKDALKKYRDNKRRGSEAIAKLKIDGIEIKGAGLSVISNAAVQQYQQVFVGGVQQQTAVGQTTFSETLTIIVRGIDKLTDDQVHETATKLLDAAKDAGLAIGQPADPRRYYDYNSYRPQVIFFRVEKPDDARQKALDLAADDAKKKAESMAKRLNVKVGRALSVRDNSSGQTVVNYPQNVQQTMVATASTAALSPVAIDASLSIEYEIVN